MRIDPKEIPVPKLHGYFLSAVAPRPIAFASTVDEKGTVNLSPFSFFNVFSTNPPILIFSPARRGRDNTTKHTLENVKVHAEVAINIVNYDMVEQMSLASTEYPKGVDEFVKSGFSKQKSERIKPPRVKEAPVVFECKVREVIALGESGGAGNLVICEVLLMHIKDEILDSEGRIDPQLIDQVARMGGDWYTRAKLGTFEVAKPLTTIGIGYDAIPASIRNSPILTGNHLGKLGNVEQLPTEEEITARGGEPEVMAILTGLDGDPDQKQIELHKLAATCLDKGHTMDAWKILLQPI